MKAKEYIENITRQYDNPEHFLVHFSDGEHDVYLENDKFVENYGEELVDHIGKFINISGCIFGTRGCGFIVI